MPAKAGIDITIRDTGADVGKPASVPAPIPAPSPGGPTPSTNPATHPPHSPAPMQPAQAKPETLPRAVQEMLDAADDNVGVVPPGKKTDFIPIHDEVSVPQQQTRGDDPVDLEAVDDPFNPMAVTPADDMSNFGITPVMVMNEFLPVQVVGEGVLHQSKQDVEDAHKDDGEGDDQERSPLTDIVDLLRPMVFGHVSGGGHGGLGAAQHMLGAVRGTALKVPAMGSMLGNVGTGLSAAAGALGEGSMLGGLAGAAGTAATAAGGALAALGPAALVLAGFAKAGELSIAAFERYTSILDKASESLKNFSPELQVAYDIDALKTEMHEYHRGARFGEQMSGFVETKGEFERATTALWDEVLQVLLDMWSAWEPQAKEIIEWMKIGATALHQLFEIISKHPIFKAFGTILDGQAELSERVRKILGLMEEKHDDPYADPLVDELFRYGRERLGPKPMFGPPIPYPLGV